MDPAMTWFYVAAIVGLLVGAVQTWFVLKRLRRAYPGSALLKWTEGPIPPWKLDPVWNSFMLLHAMLVCACAILFWFVCQAIVDAPGSLLPGPLNSPLLPESFFQQTTSTLMLLSALGLGLVFVLSGVPLTYFAAYWVIRPLHSAILTNGIASGPNVLAWSKFSHCRADSRTRLIHLYSARSPELATVAWQLPSQALYNQIMDLLREHLPEQPPATLPPWYRRRSALIGQLFLFGLPLLAIGLLLYAFGAYWAWFYYVVAAHLMTWLGYVIPRALGAV